MIGPPLTDDEMDVIEDTASRLIAAVKEQDYDTAYIIANTCDNPQVLAMFVAEQR